MNLNMLFDIYVCKLKAKYFEITNQLIETHFQEQLNNGDQRIPSNNTQSFTLMSALKMFTIGLTVLFALIYFSVPKAPVSAQPTALDIPAQSDWIDHGIIFNSGPEGAWDNILWGGFAGCVTKKDGLFYLYYQGSDDYDDAAGTVTNRAIGVATSTDGINFQKYGSNPVVSYSPNNNIEEGAVSCGISMDGTEMIMYYGANLAANSTATSVRANGIVATSADGYAFSDVGIALKNNDRNLWGSGDEVFPVMSLKAPETNQWIVYYIPNGVPQSGILGVAWGDNKLELNSSQGVTEPSGDNVATWGMGGGIVGLQDGTYVVFENDVATDTMEGRIMDPNSPGSLSDPVQTYNFADFKSGVVYYDAPANTWYLYYRNGNGTGYGVKTAVLNPSPTNQSPTVSAGQDITVEIENGTATTTLTGISSDDGLPDPPATTTANWSLVSGPASVSFADPNSLSTDVTMTTDGTYILELAVSDSELNTTDQIVITVNPTITPTPNPTVTETPIPTTTSTPMPTVSPTPSPTASPGPSCQLNSTEWQRSSIKDGRNVRLTAFTSQCDSSETISFEIYEVLAGSQSPILVWSDTTTAAGNNQAKVTWRAVNNCDQPNINCPVPGDVAQYYFVAYSTVNPSQTVVSSILSVTP